MKQILSDAERNQLNEQISITEKRTHTQIVLAVIKRCDSYAELPWKAFAYGISVTGLLLFIINLFGNYWFSYSMVPVAIAVMLFTGIAFALLTVFLPGFAKLFLTAHHAEVEARQYAESLFLSRELFATAKRTGILLLISLFEQKIILLPDKGIKDQFTKDAIEKVIAPMIPLLRRKKVSKAMEEGLKQLALIIESTAQKKTAETDINELPNEIIEEEGI